MRDIKQFKTERRDRYITPKEFAEIKKNANPTLACLMDVAYITGQRIGDCMGIRYADISETGIFYSSAEDRNASHDRNDP